MRKWAVALLIVVGVQVAVIWAVRAGRGHLRDVVDAISRQTVVRGSGTAGREARTISGVQTLATAGPWEVFVTQGDTESLEIEADANLLPLIQTSVDEGRLRVWTAPHTSLRPTKPVQVYLTVKGLSEMQVLGSGSVTCACLRSDRLEASVLGSGSITCTTEAKRVTAACFGSGEITMTGAADSQEVRINGSGHYRGGGMKSRESEATINGSGEVDLGQTEGMTATINGSGTVTYRGHPARFQRTIHGSGRVEERNG